LRRSYSVALGGIADFLRARQSGLLQFHNISCFEAGIAMQVRKSFPEKGSPTGAKIGLIFLPIQK